MLYFIHFNLTVYCAIYVQHLENIFNNIAGLLVLYLILLYTTYLFTIVRDNMFKTTLFLTGQHLKAQTSPLIC